jgi:hypothetical protein
MPRHYEAPRAEMFPLTDAGNLRLGPTLGLRGKETVL